LNNAIAPEIDILGLKHSGVSGKLNISNNYYADQWQLVADGGWLSGKSFNIEHHAVLGRDAQCNITIAGKHLSRRHAELFVQSNQLIIRDLNSVNGTFVNDKKIIEIELNPGDSVRFDALYFVIYGP
jgi:hypothetical protein